MIRLSAIPVQPYEEFGIHGNLDYLSFRMDYPLSAWLARTHPIPERFYKPGARDLIAENWLAWVVIESCHNLYEAAELDWLGLRQAREQTKRFVADVSNLVGDLSCGWLDREEIQWIKEALSAAPKACLPIYFITVRAKDDQEELVYVGRTKSSKRFAGGHAIAMKLLNPAFDSFTKHIYRCSVYLSNRNESLALEWLEPMSVAEEILDSIESQLIYGLKPLFNAHKTKTYAARYPIVIHIQNASSNEEGRMDGFLDDVILDPDARTRGVKKRPRQIRL